MTQPSQTIRRLWLALVAGVGFGVSTAPAWAATLSSQVVTREGAPLAGAEVLVLSARPKGPPSPTCDWCWSDAGRRATSDSTGRFEFAGLSDSLLFDLVVLADGRATGWCPASNPDRMDRISLWPDLIRRSPAGWRVRVLDGAGNPVPGAMVSPQFTQPSSSGTHSWTETEQFTNRDGEVAWSASIDPTVRVDVDVIAPGYAFTLARDRPADSLVTLVLGHGATVRGRVLADERPLVGIPVRLQRQDAAHFVKESDGETVTDGAGHYAFPNVPAHERYWVYAPTSATGDLGVGTAEPVSTGVEGGIVEAPAVRVRHGVRLSGRLKPPPGKNLPAHWTMTLRRTVSAHGADTIACHTDTRGRFWADDVPTETLSMEVDVPGYWAERERQMGAFVWGVPVVVRGDVHGIVVPLVAAPRQVTPRL